MDSSFLLVLESQLLCRDNMLLISALKVDGRPDIGVVRTCPWFRRYSIRLALYHWIAISQPFVRSCRALRHKIDRRMFQYVGGTTFTIFYFSSSISAYYFARNGVRVQISNSKISEWLIFRI